MPETPVRVGLFVTCLVDLFRPAIGFAAVKLLEAAGCTVEVPRAQTCCGQPAYNSGDRADSKAIARQVIAAFKDFDYVVAPSGSCAGTIREHYPELFADEPAMATDVQHLAKRTYELVSFLTDIRGITGVAARYDGLATYHELPEFEALREEGKRIKNHTLAHLDFYLEEFERNVVERGGQVHWCRTPHEAREAILAICRSVDAKTVTKGKSMIAEEIALNDFLEANAIAPIETDLGCLLNMAGKLSRRGSPVRVRHVSEVLAGMTDEVAPIGAPEVAPIGTTGTDR